MTHEKEVNGEATDKATKFLVRLSERNPELQESMDELGFRFSQLARSLAEPKRDAPKIAKRFEMVLNVVDSLKDLIPHESI